MQINIPFDSGKPVAGEASINIERPINHVFEFMGAHFFENYPKWAKEVVKFEPLSGIEVFTGAKAKQIRNDNGVEVESVFEITVYQPLTQLIFQGTTAPYKHSYLLEKQSDDEYKTPLTRLTFRFELLDLEVFMRPFEKLIRIAIEEGAEATVENIKNLMAAEVDQ